MRDSADLPGKKRLDTAVRQEPNGGMPKYEGEQVLVVPRAVFDEAGSFQGVSLEPERYLRAFLRPGAARYMDREAAEGDPSFKQLIAYGIFLHQKRILAYTRGRSGGEARLHAKLSLGIGGHINPVDGLADNLGTYMAGVEREIREEISFAGAARQKIAAIINDDSNAVGSVHLGVVHLFELETPDAVSNETALTSLRFYDPQELRAEYDRLETWSQLCLDALGQF